MVAASPLNSHLAPSISMTVDKSEARVRPHVRRNRCAADFLNHLLSLNIDKYWPWRTVRCVPPGGGPILDLCTGTGDLALAYYKASGGQATIVAADFCHPMLVLGRDKGRRAGTNGQMTFVEADAQHLPLPDDFFQIVCVAFGLRNVTDTDRGLAEMVRMPAGGKVAVLEFSQPGWEPSARSTAGISPCPATDRPGAGP